MAGEAAAQRLCGRCKTALPAGDFDCPKCGATYDDGWGGVFRRKSDVPEGVPLGLDEPRKKMGNGMKAIVWCCAIFSAIAIIAAVSPANRIEGGTSGGQPAAQAPRGPTVSFVRISDWENKANEDLTICATAREDDGVGYGFKCLDAGGRSSKGFWGSGMDVPCRSNMVSLKITLWTVDLEVVNEEEVGMAGQCLGDEHGYKITVTAGYRIDFYGEY